MNFSPKKTECFLKYRGKHATAHLQRRRTGPDGSLEVRIPGGGPAIRVVTSYKHLGLVIAADGSLHLDALHKKSAAMQAYGPLATKVFGSPVVPLDLKMCFFWSLVLSRLLYNAHVLVPAMRYVRVLSSVYMRVVRRVFASPRFGPDDSDLTVRRRFRLPSVDCLLRRARLRFLGRVVLRQPPALLAILGTRHKGAAVSWVDL
eukprot:15988393-Heterocapsa_arctica.AAC.1